MSRFKNENNNENGVRYRENGSDYFRAEDIDSNDFNPIKITHLDGKPLSAVNDYDANNEQNQEKGMMRKVESGMRNSAEDLPKSLPKIKDPTQKRAARNIALFMVVMLLLTIIARGASAATLATITTTTPGKAEIVDEFRGSATVKVSDKTEIHIPAGLTIKEVLVSGGQEIEAGTDIVKVDNDELGEMLERERVALKDMELKLSQLLQSDITDNTSLSQAQQALSWAKQDLSEAKIKGKKAIDEAESKLKKAKQELENLKASRVAPVAEDLDDDEDVSKPDIDDEPSLEAQIKEAEANVESLTENLAAVKDQVDTQIKSAERAVESASQALTSAEIGASKMQQEQSNSKSQKELDAEAERLDIEAQKKKIDELCVIYDNGGVAKSDKAGTVLETQNSYEKTSELPVVKLADTGGGYEAEFSILEKETEKLNVGDKVDIIDNSSKYYSDMLEGKIIEISEPEVDETCKVKISLPDKKWKQGQTLDIRVPRSRESFQTCIPISGLRSDNSGYYVLVSESKSTILGTENVLTKIPVILEAKDESNAAISGAFSYEAEVVIGSDKPIENGSRVRLGNE